MSNDPNGGGSAWWQQPITVLRSAMRGVASWHNSTTTLAQIVGCSTVLVMLGLTMVLSSTMIEGLNSDAQSPYKHFLDQAVFAVIGLVAASVAAFVPVRWYRLASPFLLGLGIVLQLLVFSPLGAKGGGNQNWIFVGGMSFQPSEASKLALILWLAAALAARRDRLHRPTELILPVLLPVVGVLGLTLAGKDLGTGVVIMFIAAGAIFVSGLPLRVCGVLAAVGIVVSAWSVSLSSSRKNRISQWWNNTEDPYGLGYQIERSNYALAGGGAFGTGVGSSPEKWGYLSEGHNDFIFSVIGAELGYVGSLIVLALYVILAISGLKIVERHTDPFVRIATAGIVTWLVGQAIINISVVVGLLPVLGVPLPLVSSGGSALVMCMIAVGVLVSFARVEPKPLVGLDEGRPQPNRRPAGKTSTSKSGYKSGSKLSMFGTKKQNPARSGTGSRNQPSTSGSRSSRKVLR